MLYDEKTTLTRRSTERILTEEETSILIGIADREKQDRSGERMPAAAIILSIIPFIVFGVVAYSIYSKNYILFGYIMGSIFAIAGTAVSIPKPNAMGVAFALAGIWCIAILSLRNSFPDTDSFILTIGVGEVAVVGLSILIGLVQERMRSREVEAVCTGYARRAITDHTGRKEYRIVTYPIFMIDGKEYIPNSSGSYEDAGFDVGESVKVRLEKDGHLIVPAASQN